jgi:hypothetical protein
VWSSGRWLLVSEGPGGRAIMASAPASSEQLRQAGVDCSPIPSNYDPLLVESEDSMAGSHSPSGPVDLNDCSGPFKED